MSKSKSPPLPAFAHRLAALRQAQDLSAYALAAKSGIPRQTLSRLERGDYEPTWRVACAIADALGVSVQDFREP